MKNLEKQGQYYNCIEKKVLEFCKGHDMFAAGETVILGVSGGADSVCLLAVLCALKKELGITLHVAHVNHGVREDADKDEAYVEKLCRERNIPFYLKKVDMNALAADRKCSPEEAGRNARYGFFQELIQKLKAEKIAVAHNMGDCAETMLFNLFRGSGLTGLSGIRPVRDNIVRPILCLERKEIEEYLEEKGISFCHDYTNDSDDYTRNKIRHHILSFAEEEIVSGSGRNIYEASRQIAQTQEYIASQVEDVWPSILLEEKRDFCVLNQAKLAKLHVVLQKEILRKAVGKLVPGYRDITREHIESLCLLVTEGGNRQVHLPYGLRGERSYEKLLLYIPKKEEPPEEITIHPEDLKEGKATVSFGEQILEIKVFSYSGKVEDIPQNQYTKWLDYDKIIGNFAIRTRCDGDYFIVKTGDVTGRKKVKDYLMDEKIPRTQRDKLMMVAQGSHVLWLVPYRISEYYKVTQETKTIIQLCLRSADGGMYGET